MKIIQKMAFGNEWGRFVWREIPAGYKAGAEISVQQQEYKKLWEDTKKKLETLTEETVLSGVSLNEAFDINGQELLSIQISKMLGENGVWEKGGDFPKTKFVMKKLTEMGFKINNPKDFIGKNLHIENGNIVLFEEKVENKGKIKAVKVSFADEIMAGDEGKDETSNTDIDSSSREALSSMEKITTQVAPISSIKKDQKKSVSEKVLGSKVEQKEKSPEELILEGKNAVRDFWGLKGVVPISRKIRRSGFSKTVENLSVTTTGGKRALVFKEERFILTENAEGILKNLKETAAMNNEVIENYWDNMARLAVSRHKASKPFDKYEDCFFDLPEDISFKGITKKEHNLIFKRGLLRMDVSFDSEGGTYVIEDISMRTNLDKISYAKKTGKIGKVLTHEELIEFFHEDGLELEIDEER